MCGERVEWEDLQVPSFPGAVFEGQSAQGVGAARWTPPPPISELPVLASLGSRWQGAAAVTTLLKERHSGPGQDGSGRGSGGGCQLRESFPAGSVILSHPHPPFRRREGGFKPVVLAAEGVGARGSCFRELELAVLPVCESLS